MLSKLKEQSTQPKPAKERVGLPRTILLDISLKKSKILKYLISKLNLKIIGKQARKLIYCAICTQMNHQEN